jgi:hypothetical protein
MPRYAPGWRPELEPVPVRPVVTLPGFAIAKLALNITAQARTDPPLVATTLATEIRLCSIANPPSSLSGGLRALTVPTIWATVSKVL